MKYQSMDWGRMESVVNKLGGLEGVDQFLKGEIVIRTKDGKPIWQVWKTIVIGTFENADKISDSLYSNGIDFKSVESVFKDLLRVYPKEREVCLVRVTLKDLGLDKLVIWADLLETAQKLGLSICPPDVGPCLCLQYKDSEKGEVLTIGMYGLVDSTREDDYHVFSIWNGPRAYVSTVLIHYMN